MTKSIKTFTDVQRVMDFVSKSSPDPKKFSYASSIELVNALEIISSDNDDIDIRYRMGDGLIIFYKGVSHSLILQNKKHIRVIVFNREDTMTRKIDSTFTEIPKWAIPNHKEGYRQWNLSKEGAEVFIDFWSKIRKTSQKSVKSDLKSKHPRHFSTEVRRIAYSQFEQDGFICMGFGKKPHKVDILAGDRIEYDHILPVAKGGSNSDINVQVMCESCNRSKRDIAS